jgi:tetratricopeptide (TPR) repeat protein
VIAGLVFVTYANTRTVPFVYDDILAIPENPSLRRWWSLPDVLLPAVEGGVTVSGRPVLNLSFAFNYAVSGTAVWSYHALNAVVHAAAALALYGTIRRTLLRQGSNSVHGAPLIDASNPQATSTAHLLGLLTAALWALHPLQTQAVTYTVQRAESLMGLFYLATLYGFIRATDTAAAAGSRQRWTFASVGVCALGMGTKEVMATAPLLVFLYDRTFGAGSFRAAWRNHGRVHLALAATWLVLVACLASTGGNRGGTVGLGVGQPLWAYPLTQFEALARYLSLSAWPHPLVFEYGTFWVKDFSDVAPYALLLLPLLSATALALWRWPAAGFLGVWFFLILAPTSLAPGTIQMIVEHRMYLPLAALIAGAVLAVWRLGGPRASAGLAVAALAFGALAAQRNHDYRSALALWSDTVAKRPQNPRAQEGLAEALAAAGNVDAAIRVRQESVRLLPDESQYHYNLALTLAQAGREEDAVRHYQLALRMYPTEPRTHNNLAILLSKLGRTEEALPHYAEAVRLRPGEPLFHYNRGVALVRAGQLGEALASYAAAIALRPDYADAHLNLGTVLLQLRREREALEHYQRAAALRPDDADLAVNYASALLVTGKPAEALAEFERAARIGDRPVVDALFGAGNALVALRRHDEAIARFRAVLQRSPQHADAHYKLGNALLDVDRVLEAIPHYEAAARLSPRDAEARHNLGIAFARLERYDEARAAFDAALEITPDYADARRSREQLRQVTGR